MQILSIHIKKAYLNLFLLCFMLASSHHILAQDSLYLKKIICDLSAPEMYGRGTPYQGDLKAAVYIQKELESLHIQPLGETYFQNYPIYGYDMSGMVSLSLNSTLLKNFFDYRLPFNTPSINGNYKLIEAPLEILDYVNENGVCTFSSKAEKKWKKFQRKYKEELKNQIIYFNMDEVNQLDVDTVTRLRMLSNLNDWKVSKSNGFGFTKVCIGTKNLPGFGTRPYPEKDFAFFYIKPEFLSQKNSVEIHFTNKMEWRTTQNVCGIVEGTQYKDSFIVFIGHYDHLGLLGDSCIFNGAFDNASGTAYVLAFAKYFKEKPLKYSTVFILASGEESGLQGSTYFVEHPLIPLQNIKQVLNFDLLCGGNDGVLFFNGIDSLCLPFLTTMDVVNQKEQWVPKIDKRKNIPNSDHFPFTQKQVPALFALTMGGLKPPTHHPDDKCESCGVDASERILKLFIRTLENF